MPKPEKIEVVATLKEKFSTAEGFVLADYTGLTVEEVNGLRGKCKEADIEYKVIKNTLAKIAVKEANLEGVVDFIDGPTAVALSVKDSVAPARVLAAFMREIKKMAFRGGYVDGRAYSADEIKEISRLPGKDGLIAQVMGALNAPMANIVWNLEGNLRNLVSIIDQISKKKGNQN
jgi:large subunit ribosomal protein L10